MYLYFYLFSHVGCYLSCCQVYAYLKKKQWDRESTVWCFLVCDFRDMALLRNVQLQTMLLIFLCTIDRLIEDGKLMDALAISDRFLRDGASDKLLRLLIEREESHQSPGSFQGYHGRRIRSTSWQYCLRLKDKRLAAVLALRYATLWQILWCW